MTRQINSTWSASILLFVRCHGDKIALVMRQRMVGGQMLTIKMIVISIIIFRCHIIIFLSTRTWISIIRWCVIIGCRVSDGTWMNHPWCYHHNCCPRIGNFRWWITRCLLTVAGESKSTMEWTIPCKLQKPEGSRRGMKEG